MATRQFVLDGPNAGKFGVFGGYIFRDGVCTVVGSEQDIDGCRRIVTRYHGAKEVTDAAVPTAQPTGVKGDVQPDGGGADAGAADAVKPDAGAAPAGEGGQADDAGGQERPAEEVKADDWLGEDGTTSAEVTQEKPAQERAAELNEAAPKPDLLATVQALDPTVDAHWSSNNLPALDELASRMGRAVSRAEVEAVAPKYTRAKARAAKAVGG